jgi:predicted DNA binding protein
MATLMTATVPCEEFALATTIRDVPDVRFQCEQVVETGGDAVMPLLWACTVEFDALDEALGADPTVVDSTVLTSFDDMRLYCVEWDDSVPLLFQMIASRRAIVLDTYTEDGRWVFRILHSSREDAADVLEFCEGHGLSMDVRSIREMEFTPTRRYGLTDEQFRVLALALERGYFEVPRSTSLKDLSEELPVTHQAVSERLRRGVMTVLEETVGREPPVPSEEPEPDPDTSRAESASP